MEKERFSLLLLEPGEIYFEDFSAFMLIESENSNSEKHVQMGRLKMCSKSIVFDPKDNVKPIIKISLKDCDGVSQLDEVDSASKLFLDNNTSKILANETNVICVNCKQYTEMLEGNILAPYKFRTVNSRFLFLLNYAKVSDCLPQICQLHRASTLPAAEQSGMIAAIVHSRQSRVHFDTLWLEDLYEKIILELQGNKISPLVVNPGRVLLTSCRLYFQPYNNVETYPVLKVRLQDIKRAIRRRFLLRHVGLEVYCEGGSPVHHLYLSFKSSAERDALYEALLSQPNLRLENVDQEMMTLQWQNGVLSNYDYLLYLNSLADRTFNDLTQYPVFPWVISDYSSKMLDLNNSATYRDLEKPIGALNEVRLNRLKERYEEMSPPKFLYGSHYSAPGFVLFYLVRKFPHFMLCLQNGRFDHPDRMFNSIPDVWKNVLTNMADFKELIPAFYDVNQGGDFLVNEYAINFGYRHDGVKVGDVLLPPWAEGPQDFIKKHREALESDYVSRHLHHWVDLIFGYKQLGTEAEKANNVFYYLCYEGSVDLDSITDLNQRHALEVQIMEFGQIPKQIFTLPHPQRRSNLPRSISVVLDASTEDWVNESCESPRDYLPWNSWKSMSILVSFQSHKEPVTSVAIAKNNQFVVSVGQDSLLKMYTVGKEKRQARSVTLSPMALSSCIVLPDDKTLLVGCWDNNIIIYNLEFGRVMDSVRAHEDAVSCLVWAHHTGLLVSGSWDCSVRVWQGISEGKNLKLSSSLVSQLDHDAHITCLSVASDSTQLVSGTQDGDLFLWCMKEFVLKRRLPGHKDTVRAVSFSPDGTKLVSCGDDCMFSVLDLVTGMQLYSKSLDEELRSLCWNGYTLLLGTAQGSLYIWDLIQVELQAKVNAHAGAVTSVAVAEDGSAVVTGGEDRRVVVWQPIADSSS